ncbi:putative DNA mismatch repair protein MutS [Helianthus annuus]|nr:putative DNA mismatch repair protein MutS [Helianthus annuus]
MCDGRTDGRKGNMCWVTARSLAISALHSCPPLPLPYFSSFTLLLCSSPQPKQVYCFKERRSTSTKSAKKMRELKDVLVEKDYPHIMWWKEKMLTCVKTSSIQLVTRLVYSNLLGLDDNLKNGSLKEGTLNCEILKFKSRFPREVLLCRVGDFYEAIGFDACILVEYAGLNPCGGLRSDSVPKAGCPVVNLRQTLDDLTRNGFSVCIVEEVQGPTQARSRKSRFISGHAHPGSPYVFGLVEDDRDLEFPEPMPVVGVSRSAKGYCMVSVLETMKTFSLEDGLTEEALVTKLRTCRYHHLFLHKSLKNNSSGTSSWREFGEGGLLWAECNGRHFEWLEGDMLDEILFRVKELYGLDDNVTFRNVTIASENRPRPLHLGTASQIGAIQTEGIPFLLKYLLPSNCTGLPAMYVRDLLLNPPAYAIASTIQDICKLMSNVSCTIPEFTCITPSKLVKLLELRETNHVEFCKIKSVLDEVLQLYSNSELNEILRLLMDPTWVATGLKIDMETLVKECECVSRRISEIISTYGESNQKMSSHVNIPNEFFEEMESSWKGRVKRIHLIEAYEEVDKAAGALSLAVTEDFLPVVTRVRATTASFGGPRGEIAYAREHKAIWFKGKRFTPAVWAGTLGEEQIKQLRPSVDARGRKVGEEWFTTVKVEDALTRYHEACANAKTMVLDLLRELSAELQAKVNVLVFASMLLVIAKALFAHVSEGRRRKWVFPTLIDSSGSQEKGRTHEMQITGLSPYWFDAAEGSGVRNTIVMKSMFLLTGPNGGGKSSLLRSICAAALFGICGFMVPAESATIPQFDSIMLHMKSYDSPADGKSSFQIEMSELQSIIVGATSKSLVLVDEICRGTETAKGTCIAASIVETLDSIGCLGIVSTHLHDIFKLPLTATNTVFKAMGSEHVDGQTKPTWKLIDGICRESLAFETAKREGVPEAIIQRAEELYISMHTTDEHDLSNENGSHKTNNHPIVNETLPNLSFVESTVQMQKFLKEVESTVRMICQRGLIEVCKMRSTVIRCVLIAPRQQPPPSAIGASSVYVILRPDNRLYVGETDDLEGRVRAHRSKQGMQNASFLYFLVPGKSVACQLETLLINQLPKRGFQLTNIADANFIHNQHQSLQYSTSPQASGLLDETPNMITT